MPKERALRVLTAHLERLEGLQPVDRAAAPVSGLLELDGGALAARLNCGAGSLACALSSVLGGQFIVSGGGVVWVNGREVVYLVDWAHLPAIQQVRAAAAELLGEAKSWTVGGNARHLLQWTGARQPHRRGQDAWLKALPWSYTQVEPGTEGEATLYDLEGAYFAALCRLPSPHVDWLPDGPCWHPLKPDEGARWAALLERARPLKPLRLCLVGCMRGGGDNWVSYHKGERLKVRRQQGPLPTAALLCVRAVYELTALAAAEGEARLANTDSVLLKGAARPRAWERYGYRYRVQAQGDAEVCSLAVYRVGTRQTIYYGQGSRWTFGAQRTPQPARWTLPAWH